MEQENILTPEEITKYHTAAVICKKVYNELKELIKRGERDIRVLSNLGNSKIDLELNKIYKKENKYIGLPVSISLNNCVGNYVYDCEKDEYNTIKEDDIIKIELGVNIGGCISILGETFTINNVNWVEKANNFLIKLQKKILKLVENGYTGDDLRMYIESECTKVDMFPVENTVSYQSERDFLKTSDGKYFILNNVKHYDQDENLISLEFVNYEFETNDIYNINLSVIPINPENDNKIVIKNYEKSHLYTLNDYTYQLKMKSSRAFYNTIK
jgi:methionine aminopeptidase